MADDDNSVEVIREHIRKRNEARDEKFLFGAERVDLKRVSNLKFEARKRQFTFYIDEPPDREGPTRVQTRLPTSSLGPHHA